MTPKLALPPMRDNSVAALNDLVVALNGVLKQIHDALAERSGDEGRTPTFGADLDLGGHQILNSGDIHGPLGVQQGLVRIFPAATVWPSATTSFAVPGAATVNRDLLEKALGGLGQTVNDVVAVLRRFQRVTEPGTSPRT